ncbi:hypothetical protein [Flammeovirga kamogawensis]|nr:hypothetical protein [Flammeovirga kamogawensis]MBB6461932.1 putative CXXCH cytochrome family protein [Flammeovirga kamogawensis]
MEKKSTMKKHTLLFFCLLVLSSLVGCSSHDSSEEKHHGHESNLMKIKRLSNSDTTQIDASVEEILAFIKTVEVDSIYVGKAFLIPERESQITSFKCSNCHSKPLSAMQRNDGKYKKSHWNLELKHANADVMNCQTCHTANDMDHLHTLTNGTVKFNDSYKVCAQCHSSQFKDWKGGAHGKRLGGWAKPIAKQTCVGCHNPHKPAFGKRLPAVLNTKVTEQRRGK